MTYPAQPNYGAQQPVQYPQGPALQQQYVPAPQQVDLQPMMYGQQPQYQQPPQQSDANQFFAQQPQQPAPTQTDTAGFFGGGSPFLSWDNGKGYVNGTWYGGQVLDKRIVPQTDMDTGMVRMSKYNPNEPIVQMDVELQTSMRVDPQDNGRRRISIRAGLVRAAREAYQAAGDNDIQLGSWFYCTKTGQESVPNANGKGTIRRNTYQAVYAKPGSPDPAPQPAAGALQPPQHVAAMNGVYQAAQQYQPAPPQQQQYQQPGSLGQAPQQAMANFAQAAQFDPAVQAATGMTQGQLAQISQGPGMPQYQQPAAPAPQQFAQSQQVPYGALPGNLSAQTNGQHPEQVQQFAQPASIPQGQAQSGYNPFGPTATG